ncbi:thermostable hemolysin [Marinobacterium nitratireducens]|uniref:Thermostable hemolysin n=1 Tax=Marinobacterium nitratireducens TaxID=518897 RepID=A0A918DXD1_9GAMM|nr:thermostable hemolysin [Marinobacterium nitratireducens]GGO86762.1 thermostable hemolysin [Marinobacterium nitratireducens]
MQPRTAPQQLNLISCAEGTELYERIKRFACARYADVHQARLRHFLPQQILLRDGNQWKASCGIRYADRQPLFLEQYLDAPVEDVLRPFAGKPVRREQIVEVGNLAGERGSARLMILSLTRYLTEGGIDFVVFTATRELQHAFSRLGLSLGFLTEARAQRLASGLDDWGHYYRHNPAVFAGSVADGWSSIQQQPMLRRLLLNIDNEAADAL